MNFIGKFFLWFFLAFIVLFILAWLTFLSWWNGWPLFTGLLCIAGAAGAVILFFVLRSVYRWRDRTLFAKKVMEEQRISETAATSPKTSFATAWQAGLPYLNRGINTGLPCFPLFDMTEKGSKNISLFGTTQPENDHGCFYWHFLPSSVYLHSHVNSSSAEDREELLSNLSAAKALNIQGIVFSFSICDILNTSEADAAALGQECRKAAQQIMLAKGILCPVFFLVEELDGLVGMNDILEVCSDKDVNKPLGCLFEDYLPNFGRAGAASAVKELENIIRTAAVKGNLPHGNMLAVIEKIRSSGNILDSIAAETYRETFRGIRPLPGGIFFCASPTAAFTSPAFLGNLLAKILPDAARSEKAEVGLNFQKKIKSGLMGAWLLLTLCLCGIFSANVVYQYDVLKKNTKELQFSVTHDDTINRLYGQMQYILHLEQAQKLWLLPTFGNNLLQRAEESAKLNYCDNIEKHVLYPVINYIDTVLSTPELQVKTETAVAITQQLLWLCAAFDLAIDDDISALHQFPLVADYDQNWTPVNGLLILRYIKWLDSDQVVFSKYLDSLLNKVFTRTGNNLFEHILNSIDKSLPGSQLCLSDYWSHMETAVEGERCIPSLYTAQGALVLEDVFHSILEVAGQDDVLKDRIEFFKGVYYKKYEKLWHDFVGYFSSVVSNIRQTDTVSDYSAIKDIEAIPHMRLFRQMSKNLLPLANQPNPPAWVQAVLHIGTIADIATYKEWTDSDDVIWAAFNSLINIPSDMLQRLRQQTTSLTDLKNSIKAAGDLHLYFKSVINLLPYLDMPIKAKELATVHFSAESNTDQGNPSSYTESAKLYDTAFRNMSGSEYAVPKQLMHGMLDFIAQGITVQTAAKLQREWENDVLSSPAALYDEDSANALYGEKGIVPHFAETKLKAFLSHRSGAPVAAHWGSIEFPFTADFLSIMSRSERIAAKPLPKSYNVLLRSQPTVVNTDAKELPQSTQFTIRCKDQEYRLLNRNYPHDASVTYEEGQCSKPALEIRFPSMTLRKEYASFHDFLHEFQFGEKLFGPDDFPDASEKFKSAGVHDITVRILPDNASDIIERNANIPSELPERITYVW